MNFNNTKTALSNVIQELQILNDARARYLARIDGLSEYTYKLRTTPEGQNIDRRAINRDFITSLKEIIPIIKTGVKKMYDAFEKDRHPECGTETALNSTLIYLNAVRGKYDSRALSELMRPIILKQDFQSYVVLYNTCEAFTQKSDPANMDNFPHKEFLDMLRAQETVLDNFAQVKKAIDDLIDPETIIDSDGAIEPGDQLPLIEFVKEIRSDVSELESPENIIHPADVPLTGTFSMDVFKRIR